MRKSIKQGKCMTVRCRFLVEPFVISLLIFVNMSPSVGIITNNNTVTGSRFI